MDVASALVLRSLIQELAARGKVVLFSSHELETVERVCSHIVILHRGKVVAVSHVGVRMPETDAGRRSGNDPLESIPRGALTSWVAFGFRRPYARRRCAGGGGLARRKGGTPPGVRPSARGASDHGYRTRPEHRARDQEGPHGRPNQ